MSLQILGPAVVPPRDEQRAPMLKPTPQPSDQGQPSQDAEVTDLEGVIEKIQESTKDRERVSLGDVLDTIGHRSFGPMLLVVGVVTVVPGVGDIPGVTIVVASIVLIIIVQLLFKHEHLWLPQWILNRSMSVETVHKGLKWVQRPARFIDKGLQPRLHAFTNRYAVSLGCVLIALIFPFTELIPFSTTIAGAALIAFSLAMVARDGLFSIVAYLTIGSALGLLFYGLS